MPAASESPGPGASEPLVRYRPRGVRVVGAVVFAVLALSPVVTWLLLPQTARDRFVGADLVLLLFLALLFAVAGYAVLRCRVDATERGLVVVNGFRTHDLPWAEVARLGLPRGAPFARVETLDDRSLNMLGIQGSDGAYAKEAVRHLARMNQERRRTAED
ncbi:PH domain-containing protein [Nocardioidaceae bacterium]|nr:PH domain-containing protein [Nocardioidaceae bacterium]